MISIISKLLFLFLFIVPLEAQITRYVSINGNDQGNANTCTNEETPCRTIGQAINVATSGDIIEIGAGAYTESLTINKSLSLYGAGEGITIIQSHEEPYVSTARVINISPGLDVAITGVTIRHGGTAAAVSLGGGINNNGSKLKLTDVTITQNRSFGAGGGMATSNNSVDTLINVIFQGNDSNYQAGGLMMLDNNNTTLIDVIFSENSANSTGGAIYAAQNSRFSLVGVTFKENIAEEHGGGIINYSDYSPVINNVIFIGNSSSSGAGGGIYNESSSPVFTNVVFSGNHGVAGGGMYNTDGSAPVLTNVTFSGNSADGEGGGMYSFNSNPTIRNSIFWNNADASGIGTPGASVANLSSTVNIYYSMVQGCKPSGNWSWECGDENEGNLTDADPLFNVMPDPGNTPTTVGDLRLQEESPVIDAGDPDIDLSLFPGGPDNPVDLNNDPRVFNGRIDLGAYEYIDPTSVYEINELPVTVALYQNYPNPFNPSTTISYSLPEHAHIELIVFDMLGREVAVLVEGQQMPGTYEIRFDAGHLASGIYLYRLRAGEVLRSGRMMLMR